MEIKPRRWNAAVETAGARQGDGNVDALLLALRRVPAKSASLVVRDA
jgi:hypothetical protein